MLGDGPNWGNISLGVHAWSWLLSAHLFASHLSWAEHLSSTHVLCYTFPVMILGFTTAKESGCDGLRSLNCEPSKPFFLLSCLHQVCYHCNTRVTNTPTSFLSPFLSPSSPLSIPSSHSSLFKKSKNSDDHSLGNKDWWRRWRLVKLCG